MTTAREIVARARKESRDKSDLGVLLYQAIAWPSEACGTALMDENLHDWQVRAILDALTAAGFRILGPDEIDGPTVEKCAEVSDSLSETWSNSRDAFQAVQEASASDKAFEIAAALRALKEEQG